MAARPAKLFANVDEELQRETENLKKSWMRHDEGMLREYLVQGVEDPRVNVSSILSRHSLIVALLGARFERLMEQELRFATVMNWLIPVLREAASNSDIEAIRHALATGADDAEGIPIPRFVGATYASLGSAGEEIAVPNYIEDALSSARPESEEAAFDDGVLSTFERLWRAALEQEAAAKVSVVELACGSANDYRYLHSFGLARLIDYTGIDLCENNVRNARAMFPEARFVAGNALAIDAPDRAFDYCLVQDLFEHLSVRALDYALDEVCRVTRRGFCLGLFSGFEGEDHVVRPVDDYHWNTLSIPRLTDHLGTKGFQVEVVHIETMLRWRFGCPKTHNPTAYTLFGQRQDRIE